MVRDSLRMRHGVGQVSKSLFLTPRREPRQGLPQHGKNQKMGTGASRHAEILLTSNFKQKIAHHFNSKTARNPHERIS
jgi:hypothetical protein